MSRPGQRGQAIPLVLLVAVLLGCAAIGVFWLGHARAAQAHAQTAADLTAVSAGRRLRDLLPTIAAAVGVERERVRAEVEDVARRFAVRNRAALSDVSWPDSGRWPPATVQVTVTTRGPAGVDIAATARVVVAPGRGSLPEEVWRYGTGSDYSGPLEYRDGKPMCPAVAAAFDRMDAAAGRVGIDLVVSSGFRSDAEQAELFRRHPDPKWVARPGQSRHRNATELDIAGRPGAWEWLAGNAPKFGFVQRYAWEPWHYGFISGCGAGPEIVSDASGTGTSAPLPDWVPVPYRELIRASAAQGGVPPIVLASLLQAESGYDRWAISPAGAQGIAQFMPATAAGMGLRNPFDPSQAIPAAGRLLGGHLRRFGSIPLALAAYNAGPGAVERYGGVPPYAETRAYVSRIMALAGDPSMWGAFDGSPGSEVHLVRVGDLLV